MGEGEAAGLALIFGVVGGALGARMSGADAWRGAVVALLATILAALIMFLLGTLHPALVVLMTIVLAAVIGGALKLETKQVVSVVAGLAMVSIFGGMVIGMIA